MPPKRTRASSPVFGEDSTYTKRSANGRPMRHSAGKRAIPAGYIRTEEQQSSASDANSSEDEAPTMRGKKRKLVAPARSLKPESDIDSIPEPLSSDFDEEENDLVEDMVVHTPKEGSPELPMISVHVNVPAGHKGPFVVKINLDGLKGEALTKAATKSEQIIATTEANASSSISNSTGFLNLPAELRNDIYRMVHVSANSISLPFYPAANRKQLQLSSAFLATCRQVHTEASQILYGYNTFNFRRDHRERGKVWEDPWHEIGWRDNYSFLSRIGAHNVANIRTISLQLRDASPIKDDYTDLHRCVNDTALKAMLKLLGSEARLQKFTVFIQVRRSLLPKSDRAFVKILSSVKADEVTFHGDYERVREGPFGIFTRGYGSSKDSPRPLAKMSRQVEQYCMGKMERSKKLYG